MTTDRNVSLRTDVGHQALSDPSAQQNPDTQRQATPESRDAFLKAMHTPSEQSESKTQSRDSGADDSAREHSLPRGIPPVSLPVTPATENIEASIQHDLCDSLERLLVSDEDNRQEVRLDLKDDALPGVTVRLFEAEGGLTVCFICSVDSVRRRLDAAISELAQQLATRLQRDVLLQVQTDDPHDLRLNEAQARAQW